MSYFAGSVNVISQVFVSAGGVCIQIPVLLYFVMCASYVMGDRLEQVSTSGQVDLFMQQKFLLHLLLRFCEPSLSQTGCWPPPGTLAPPSSTVSMLASAHTAVCHLTLMHPCFAKLK